MKESLKSLKIVDLLGLTWTTVSSYASKSITFSGKVAIAVFANLSNWSYALMNDFISLRDLINLSMLNSLCILYLPSK